MLTKNITTKLKITGGNEAELNHLPSLAYAYPVELSYESGILHLLHNVAHFLILLVIAQLKYNIDKYLLTSVMSEVSHSDMKLHDTL